MTVSFSRIREYLAYSPATGDFTWIKNPVIVQDLVGATAGTLDSNGYVKIQFNRQFYMAHRLAWFFVHGEWPSLLMDHINGSRADNRIANLRLATPSQNGMNRPGKPGRGLPKGVYLDKNHGTYRAEIECYGVRHRLGSFPTPDLAGAAYADAAKRLHGEFARAA